MGVQKDKPNKTSSNHLFTEIRLTGIRKYHKNNYLLMADFGIYK